MAILLASTHGRAGAQLAVRVTLGFLLAFGIGVLCRLCKIPSPAPQAVLGSMLVVAMSAGFVAADRFAAYLSKQQAAQQTFRSDSGAEHAGN